mmetsp:Transcript_87075/g.244226  ORF Transcript_87075/g.244226 Transcript_87075/m.244226 type:complete len:142 (+) Transcript_87075:885-1310(+)
MNRVGHSVSSQSKMINVSSGKCQRRMCDAAELRENLSISSSESQTPTSDATGNEARSATPVALEGLPVPAPDDEGATDDGDANNGRLSTSTLPLASGGQRDNFPNSRPECGCGISEGPRWGHSDAQSGDGGAEEWRSARRP